ncbi:MAG: glycosyltransferase family 4 protein [Acidimicrobiales bacterium]|nr:glycosyltransferase family 4 protein [Acidimicrobiales bacterium]
MSPPSPLPSDLRVVHVVTRYTGGSVRRVLDVVRTVPGEHVVIVGPDSDLGRVAELDDLASVVIEDGLRREVSPTDARAVAALRARLRGARPHVVHTHQSKGGLLGRVAARAAGVPVVYHSASMASFGPGYGRAESAVFRAAEWSTAPLVDRYFVVGRDLADRLANGARVPRRKLEVVRSTIDADRFAPGGPSARAEARAALGLDPHEPVVAYVGSLEPRKGVTVLPEAVAVASAGAGTLVVAGDGPQAAEVEAEAERLGLRARLLGHVDRVQDVMRAADVVALPSGAEGLPQVLVQAAMVGVPFVAHDVDGVRELIDGGAAGRVVPLGDRDRFADALRTLLARRERRVAPRSRWAEWGLDHVGRRYRAAYSADLTRGTGARRPGA